MQHTEHYDLNIIETSDKFSPEALNENTRKLDAELARLDGDLGATGANCRIVTGTYKGTGSGTTTVTFGRHPEIIFIYGYSGFTVFFRHYTSGYVLGYNNSSTVYNATVSWGAGGTVTWYHYSNSSILNSSGATYYYIALFA